MERKLLIDDATKLKASIADYVLFLGGLIVEMEGLQYQFARRGDLEGHAMYGQLVRDMRRYRDAIETTAELEMEIPPNVATWLRAKLNKPK